MDAVHGLTDIGDWDIRSAAAHAKRERVRDRLERRQYRLSNVPGLRILSRRPFKMAARWAKRAIMPRQRAAYFLWRRRWWYAKIVGTVGSAHTTKATRWPNKEVPTKQTHDHYGTRSFQGQSVNETSKTNPNRYGRRVLSSAGSGRALSR